MPNSVSSCFDNGMRMSLQVDSNDTPQPMCEFFFSFICYADLSLSWFILILIKFQAGVKHLHTEFGIHQRLVSCRYPISPHPDLPPKVTPILFATNLKWCSKYFCKFQLRASKDSGQRCFSAKFVGFLFGFVKQGNFLFR